MTVNISGSLFTSALKSCIEAVPTNDSVFTDVQLYSGDFPNSIMHSISADELLNSQAINSTNVYTGTWINDSSMPTHATNYPIAQPGVYAQSNSWNRPSSGIITLSQSVPIYIKNNTVINGKIPSFLRFYKVVVDGIYVRQPMLDIAVSDIQEYRKALLSSISPVTNGISQVLAIKKLGFKIAVTGDACFNNSFANCILQALCIKTTRFSNSITSYPRGYHFGLPYCNNTSAAVATPITISAYDGTIPDSANYEATGNLLWTSSYSATTGNSIYSISGNSFSLERTFTANAIMTGTPTYIRVVKSAYTHATDSTNYPRAVIQIPVGNAVNKANFTKLNFVSGESISLESFTITLGLTET